MPVPQTVAAVVRCVLDSLALSYRAVLDGLTQLTGRRPASVNIVGGGSDNTLLSQLTADATGLPVYCGPTEGTALGNGAVQLAALGEFAGLADIRQAIANSVSIRRYEPQPDDAWLSAQERFRNLVATRGQDDAT